MSANNIVVIKKETDGKFRGYHRNYDAYCEGQYDYDGPCQFCNTGCEMCNGTGHYVSPEETSIFEVDTIEGAIRAYDKWCEEMADGLFTVEHGYQFEGLIPNEETVKAIEELDRPSDAELLDFLQLLTDRAVYTGKVICRASTTGRGWRLHETSRSCGVLDVRQAITNFMEQGKEAYL